MSKPKKTVKGWVKLAVLGALLLALVLTMVWIIVKKNAEDESRQNESESSSFVLETLWEHKETEIACVRAERFDGTGETAIYPLWADGMLTRWYQAEHPDRKLNTNFYDLLSVGEIFSVYELIRENPTQADLATFGLDEPYCRLTVELADGGKEVLLIGDLSLKGNYLYVMEEGGNAIYTTASSYRNYVSATPLDLYFLDITQIIYSGDFYYAELYKKGSQVIQLAGYDPNEEFSEDYILPCSMIRFLYPYDYRRVLVNPDLLEEVFSSDVKQSIAPVEVVNVSATEEELAAYGLSDADPEYEIRFVTTATKPNGQGEYPVYDVLYVFGHFYGENEDLVYFRQNGDNMVYGVPLAQLEQFSFDPMFYAWQPVFMTKISYIDELEVAYGAERYCFSIETTPNEDGETNSFVITESGAALDDVAFREMLANLMSIRRDSELWEEKPSYDESDFFKLTYRQTDGSVREVDFYRYDDFTYVTEVQPGLWLKCGYFQFDEIEKELETLCGRR